MESYDSMKTKLDALGLYNIEENSNIYAELKSYAAALDEMFAILETMLKELFIDTAEDYGISSREILLGREKDGFSLDKRREMLKIYEQMMGGRCTPEAFDMILRGYGLTEFEIVEGAVHNRMNININDSVSAELKKTVQERIAADFPSHLTVTVNFLEDST